MSKLRTKLEFKIDRAAGQSHDVRTHSTTIIGSGSRVNPSVRASPVKTGFSSQLDVAKAKSMIVKAAEDVSTGLGKRPVPPLSLPQGFGSRISRGKHPANFPVTTGLNFKIDRLAGVAADMKGKAKLHAVGDQPRGPDGRWI